MTGGMTDQPINQLINGARVMFSAAADSMGCAVRELRDEFGPQVKVENLGPDVAVLRTEHPSVTEVAEACRRGAVVFVRHLSTEVARVGHQEQRDLEAVTAAARRVVERQPGIRRLAVQVWVSGAPRLPFRAGEVYHRLCEQLGQDGVVVSGSGEELVLSCCLTPRGASIGLNPAALSLADWPGGRVRLARGEGRVSRSEFKLEELLQVFPVDLPRGGDALDLGASPGGWTHVLRLRGLRVWAVDPGDLHPRLAADPLVRHVRTTAGEFLRATTASFAVVVNDMRMDPLVSAQTMLDAARRLRPDGLAVLTLKTGTHQPVQTVRDCLAVLKRAYRIDHVRQLHHNRHEVTVVARRRAR
jgi:23S rRNA (cytidine2498-2'-O)-methyltransferase